MRQVLCYEVVCPVCQEDDNVSYQVEEPKYYTVCRHCSKEPSLRINNGFSQNELKLMTDLPKLVGSRSQVIWAQRIRLNEIESNPTEELLNLIETEFNANFWIKKFRK